VRLAGLPDALDQDFLMLSGNRRCVGDFGNAACVIKIDGELDEVHALRFCTLVQFLYGAIDGVHQDFHSATSSLHLD
jgi:hypothetical protein